MEGFALVKLMKCPAGCFIMPGLMSIALFQGRKYMDPALPSCRFQK